MRFLIENERGQSVVEAAFLLPLMLIVLGLLAEPSILLYNRCVMSCAAAEGCRLLETKVLDEASARMYIIRKLAAVPNADAFHCGQEEGWIIELADGGGAAQVRVQVRNRVKPLPLLGITAGLLAHVQEDGSIEQCVVQTGELWPSWALDSGASPADLVNRWK